MTFPRLALLLLPAVFGAGAAHADPEAYRVTGLAPGEPMSIRAEPDAAAEVVGEIRRRALVFGCTNDTPSRTTWCRVSVGRTVGWARRRYLTPD
ncbi:SH3 domain-containing protein [Methylobacterium komagatae]